MSLLIFLTLDLYFFFFFFQAEDGIRDLTVTGVQTCALPISNPVAPTNPDQAGRFRGGARAACPAARSHPGLAAVRGKAARRDLVACSPSASSSPTTTATGRRG